VSNLKRAAYSVDRWIIECPLASLTRGNCTVTEARVDEDGAFVDVYSLVMLERRRRTLTFGVRQAGEKNSTKNQTYHHLP